MELDDLHFILIGVGMADFAVAVVVVFSPQFVGAPF
jgi:hypothetical protein